jgi:hypothetical protein
MERGRPRPQEDNTMRKVLVPVALMLISLAAYAHGGHGSDLNISYNDNGDGAGCEGFSVRMGGERVALIAEEVPFHGRALRATTAGNGGIRVIGAESSSFGITVCKAVAAGMDASRVRPVLSGNELTVEGPDDEKWMAYLVIRAPRDASLELASQNGPISVSRFHGTLKADASNGPVSIKESSGTITAQTKNGPVSINGGSGRIKLDATNGPVTVKLSDLSWDGNLEASTRNGPVSLRLPRGFRSGVVVETDGNGPVSCSAEGCPETKSFRWDEENRPRRIQLGAGPQVIRLSTVNGPVSVKDE